MKAYALMLIALVCISASAQSTKGLSLPVETKATPEGKTYALIVGISKYKNPAIPQLQYADRDAEAFRNYLLATGVDSNNITLLINEKATNGEFWASLNFITDLAKQGDKVYIYFSGHGDVENKTVVKDAYLLPYDAPRCVYPVGAIGVLYLKSWIATFSSKGVQAIFIADACRSGHLAGGREGMEATAAMLKDKWQDEIKILSCQPGELSLEGKQWGGGRGLFSYELINGMAGMADKNKDEKVTIRELNLYLMEKVADEASPLQQNPMIFGNMETSLSRTDRDLMKRLASHRDSTMTAIDFKGFDDMLLIAVDDSVKKHYRAFALCIDSGILVTDSLHLVNTAQQHYNAIPEAATTKLLKAVMKRNFSAALMDDLRLMLSDIITSREGGSRRPDYEIVAENKLLRDLIGDSLLRRYNFLPQYFFFSAFAFGGSYNLEASGKSIAALDKAISIDSNAAYLYLMRSTYYFYCENYDRVIADGKRAIHISPGCIAAYRNVGLGYTMTGHLDSAISYFNEIISIDTSYYYYYAINKAICFSKLQNSDSTDLHYKLAGKDASHSKSNIADSASVYYHIAISGSLPPDSSARIARYSSLSVLCRLNKDYKMAINYNELWANCDPYSPNVFWHLALLYAYISDKGRTLKNLDKALSLGLAIKVFNRKEFDLIHNDPEFKALMKKYFPKEYKD